MLQRKETNNSIAVPLSIATGSACFPAPSKVKEGMRGVVKARFGFAGEDAYSVTPIVPISSNHSRLSTENSSYLVCALADGVYSWRKQGIDAGKFSRFLCRSIQLKSQEVVSMGVNDIEEVEETQRPTPLDLLSFASKTLKEADIKGSSTCCVCCIDGNLGTLSIGNIGDSGVLLLRRGVVVFKSEEQEHSFGYPYQLPFDSVSSTVEYSLQLFQDDIIVIGSDGVFDNLYEEDIEKIVRDTIIATEGQKLKPSTLSKKLAQQICSEAFQKSLNKTIVTPYSYAASEAFNMIYSGGKEDDITCIVVMVNDITNG